jgi:hypothetical protein
MARHRTPRGRTALALAVGACLGVGAAGPARAAAPRASNGAGPAARVRGDVVSWSTGAPVPGATVWLPAFGARARSDPAGTFAFARSFPTRDPYRRIQAVVTAPGFGRWTVRGVPLRPGDTLELHAELRAVAWSHTVLTPEERAALPRPPAAPGSYSSTCTGWDYTLAPPQTINVWLTADQVSKQYDFDFYATHVLPDEWISSWDADALGAGAIAVKTYGWYRAQPGHAYSGGDGCADVQDSTADQVFDPTWSNASTDQAVYATFGSTLWKNGDIFLAQYFAGANGDPCAPVTGQYAGRMSQWGTQTCAQDSVLWPDIVTTFYTDGIEWQDLQNLLLNPRFESAAMYPWTTKGYASLDRTQGGAYEGDYYGTLGITQSGQTATLRNERPFDGTSSTTYFEKVHLMCLRSANKSCTVTMKVIAIPSSGDNAEQDHVVTVPHDGAWHTYKFWTTAMGIAHVSVRFSLTTSHKIGVDAAKLTSDFGGP